MAARLFLALVALIGVMWYLSWYSKADKNQRNKSLISILLYGCAAALLILVVTGRIPWLFAMLSAATPWINRALTMKSMWNQFNQSAHANQQTKDHSASLEKMSAEEALEILGLSGNPSDEEIISAHKKLIQKIHPDKGGNEYLTTKINQARDVLLKKV